MGYGIKKTFTVTDADADGTLELDIDVTRLTSLRAFIEVTTATGETPTLNVDVQDTLDGTNYVTLFSFAEATSDTAKEFVNHTTPFGDRLRLDYAITGTTPVFTFTITIIGKE